MLNTFTQAQPVSVVNQPIDPVSALMDAALTYDLNKLSAHVREYRYDPDSLLPIIERLAKLVNSRELRITGRRFSWKQRGVTRWAVVVEFCLVRAERILLVPTEEEFKPVVLKQSPGTCGVVCADCPKLMASQVGRIMSLPTMTCPPPLMAFRNPMPTPRFA